MKDKMVESITVVALIISIAATTGTAGVYRGRGTIRGQIIAYRPAERVSEVVSHVLNKESFLFRPSDTGSNAQPAITKLVHEHFGYSELGDDLLSKTPILQLNVRRDPTCDETYGAFVQNSGTLSDDQGRNNLSERVIFIGRFKEIKLSAKQMLKCYRLERIVT